MKAVVLCEGTTDLLMIQFVLQYRYGWTYDGFVENSVTNRLIKRTFVKDNSYVEIQSCGGIMNIPKRMKKLQEQMVYATKKEELYDKVVVMIDHDTIKSNKEFIDRINEELQTDFVEEQINVDSRWILENMILGTVEVGLHIRCLPEEETGAIENVMLDALATDEIEESLMSKSRNFIVDVSENQNRYLQKKSRISKAIFNSYFAIRTPEEKYDERARILNAYDWENNEIINQNFKFLDLV